MKFHQSGITEEKKGLETCAYAASQINLANEQMVLNKFFSIQLTFIEPLLCPLCLSLVRLLLLVPKCFLISENLISDPSN